MELKNDCQVDCIKEAFDKLYNSVMPYIDLTQFADANLNTSIDERLNDMNMGLSVCGCGSILVFRRI